jgi:ATP-dependent Lon protease
VDQCRPSTRRREWRAPCSTASTTAWARSRRHPRGARSAASCGRRRPRSCARWVRRAWARRPRAGGGEATGASSWHQRGRRASERVGDPRAPPTYVGAAARPHPLGACARPGTRTRSSSCDEIDKMAASARRSGGGPARGPRPEQNKTSSTILEVALRPVARAVHHDREHARDADTAAARRMEVIELPSYTRSRRLQIARRHLRRPADPRGGARSRQVEIPDATIESGSSRAGPARRGVRSSSGSSAPCAQARAQGAPGESGVTVQRMTLVATSARGACTRGIERVRRPGVVMGLAWTPVGGEVSSSRPRMPGQARLQLTGSLGGRHEGVGLGGADLGSAASGRVPGGRDEFDYHIHVPAAPRPRDGPAPASRCWLRWLRCLRPSLRATTPR